MLRELRRRMRTRITFIPPDVEPAIPPQRESTSGEMKWNVGLKNLMAVSME